MNRNYTRSLYLLFICIALAFQLNAQKFEAESATLAGGAKTISCTSCSGGSAVAQEEGNLTLNVNLASAGFYNVYIFASAPSGDKINIFSIDETSGDFSVKQNNSYTKIKVLSTYKLTAGTHTVKILKSWGWINIDYIEFEKVDASNRFNIDQTLVTPEPIPEAILLYHFLLDHYNKRIISGGMTLNDINNSTWLEWIKTNTGKEVALLGVDFMHSIGQPKTWIDERAPIWDAKTWYNRNGIPAVMWHWRDPSRVTDEFYTSGTNFDISKVNDVNSNEYIAMLADIDKAAGLLKQLNDENIPVIWRPLHEASGGWFWWGAKGAEPLKVLWRLMFDRMVNHHGLKNLIWVWTAEPGDDAWYPGHEYADIVGRDIYKDGDHSSHIIEFNNLNDRFDGRKMIALSENGSIPDPDNLARDEAAWSWFMPWYRDHTTSSVHNPVSLWQKIMTHDYVITLDEMPDLRTYERQEVSEPVRPAIPEIPTSAKDHELHANVFMVYPTVVDDFLIIKGEKYIRSAIVYDLMGKIQIQITTNTNEASINMEELRPGVYLLKINGSQTIKLIKK